MRSYIIKRLVYILPILLAISFISFVIIQIAPGDFLSTLKMDPQISPQTISMLKHNFGLDKNFLMQYFLWLKNVCVLDFGFSFRYKVSVSYLLFTRMGNTLLLSIVSLILSWIMIVPFGLLSAVKKNTFIDRIISLFSISCIALPSFFLALIFLCLASKTNFFPVGGKESLHAFGMPFFMRMFDVLRHAFLPAFILSLLTAGPLIRILRSTSIETINADFIRACKARGLSNIKILIHVFRNAINPLITILGYQLSAVLSGAAFIEIIFSWPGLGRLMLTAVLSQDLYLIMGNLVISAGLLLIGNLIADILLRQSDPRIDVGY